jgi:nitrogen fixation NifU-like protein
VRRVWKLAHKNKFFLALIIFIAVCLTACGTLDMMVGLKEENNPDVTDLSELSEFEIVEDTIGEDKMYSEIVMDHFRNPRNAGRIEDADGIGQVGNPKCGDIMKIYLKIKDDIIEDVKFETFGCGSAIASSSIATEMIKGKSINEAVEISNKAVVEALGGLPPVKIHCSVLAEQAVKSALYDYAQKTNKVIKGLENYKPEDDEIHCQH